MSSSSFAHHHGSLVEKDGRMSSALRSSLRPVEAAEEMAAAAAAVAGPAAWGAAERGAGMVGDGFEVEDLLDLEELCEVEKDGGEHGEAATAAVEKERSSDSHGSSVVSYEPMPLLPPVMDLPAHDVEELEWVSRIMDDSLAELPVPQLPAAALAACKPQHRRPQEEGAASTLVPARTPTICALSTESLVPVKARRSKRSRASVWSLSGAPLSDSTSSSSTGTTSSCSSSASFSPFLQYVDIPTLVASDLLDEQPRSKKSKHGKSGKPKKRGRKPKHQQPPHLAASAAGGATHPGPGDRRCSHCGVQKTPQWRAGPEGAKTLCNACGVRYKSGRLLPEYRPACSPTFVSSLHSNSHRKVLEMRRKKETVIVPSAAPAVASF
ncbi:GATA transcription factor 5-like [Oryza brachyantha]|uniref:GATA transcription factor 5-like n=1 Tax=Oryza brachyantha TaxID=4533 RepID=UPI001ADA90E3|nr:GATA transcription factor 5-like [Oryza brachyantha]